MRKRKSLDKYQTLSFGLFDSGGPKVKKGICLNILVIWTLFQTAGFCEPVRVEHVEAELISENASVAPGEPFWVGVRFVMDEGWHIYWRNPGDSGMATSVEWVLPEGFKAGEIEWPAPGKFSSAGFVTYGYQDSVLLLTRIEPASHLAPGSQVTLGARAAWLSCGDICISGEAELSHILSVSAEAPDAVSPWTEDFKRARLLIPIQAKDWTIRAVKGRRKMILQVAAENISSANLVGTEFFPEDQGWMAHAAPQKIKRTKSGFEIVLELSKNLPKPLTRIKGILVVQGVSQGEAKLPAFIVDTKVEAGSPFFAFFN